MLPSILVPLGLLCGIWVPVTGIAECQQRPLPLLLISFDGFRADYLQRFPMRNLKLLYSQGVLVEEMTNVFITKTFPNHYSLVTGLYAESHGILAGSMYDPISHKHFHVANGRDAMWWNEATPIWISAHQAGYKTAVAMWPGSDVAIHNQTPTHFFPYSPDVSFRERLGNVTNWLLGNEKEEGVMFAALYWEEPDRSGHIFGPENTSAIGKVLEEVDDNIGLLMSELKRTGLWGRVNVLVTSDHGMAQCSADRLIRLDDCLHPDNYTLVDLTPVAALIPNNKPEAVFALLANCHSHMTAYLKEAIPESLHYRNNERIQPIILIADEGWTIIQRGNKLPRLGDHGYNNSLPSMHPFMAAWGPSFRNGYRLETLQSVDLYPLMCHLLALTPQPNNGTLVKARCMLVAECWQDGLALMGLVMGVLIVLATIPVLLKLMARRLRPSTSRAFRRVLVDHANDEEESLLE